VIAGKFFSDVAVLCFSASWERVGKWRFLEYMVLADSVSNPIKWLLRATVIQQFPLFFECKEEIKNLIYFQFLKMDDCQSRCSNTYCMLLSTIKIPLMTNYTKPLDRCLFWWIRQSMGYENILFLENKIITSDG
jgi:hypothetical protein